MPMPTVTFDPASPIPDGHVVLVPQEHIEAFLEHAGSDDLVAVALGETDLLPSVTKRWVGFESALDDALAEDAALRLSPAARLAVLHSDPDVLPGPVATMLPKALVARIGERKGLARAIHDAVSALDGFTQTVGLNMGLGDALVRASRSELSDEDHAALFSSDALRTIGTVLAEERKRRTREEVLSIPLGSPQHNWEDFTSVRRSGEENTLAWAFLQAGYEARRMGMKMRGEGEDAAEAEALTTFRRGADGLTVRIRRDESAGTVVVGPVRRPGEAVLDTFTVEVRQGSKVWRRTGGPTVAVPADVLSSAQGAEFAIVLDTSAQTNR